MFLNEYPLNEFSPFRQAQGPERAEGQKAAKIAKYLFYGFFLRALRLERNGREIVFHIYRILSFKLTYPKNKQSSGQAPEVFKIRNHRFEISKRSKLRGIHHPETNKQ